MFDKREKIMISVIVGDREKRVSGVVVGRQIGGMYCEYKIKGKVYSVAVPNEYIVIYHENGCQIVGVRLGCTTAVTMYGKEYSNDPAEAVMVIHRTQIAVKIVEAISGEGVGSILKWILIAGVAVVGFILVKKFMGGSSVPSDVQVEPVTMLLRWFC